MTPMMQQYRDAKARHPGMLLLFRMGDFFETFEEDAELVSRVLGLTLTSRDGSMPMAGVPARAIDGYLRRLLKAGHKVAICDQVEDASQAKGLVKREVTRVVTPGTVTEDEYLDPARPNLLAAVAPSGNLVGVAWVDATTGHFHATDVPTDRLADELARIGPVEVLAAEATAAKLGLDVATLTPRPDWTFDPRTARETLHGHFQVRTLTGYGFDDDQPCLSAAGALVTYLGETLRASLGHVRSLTPFVSGHHLALDEVTRRGLELTKTSRDGGREGSLLATIDRTVTAMGARALHDALLAPLADRGRIEARLEAVDEFVRQPATRGDLRELLKAVPDLPRLTSRVSTNRAGPRDLGAIARALRLLPKIKAKVAGRKAVLLGDLEGQLELCPDLRDLLDSALADELPPTIKEGGVIRVGYRSDLDELRRLARDGKDWLARYQVQEATRTGIPSLKVGYNAVHGYYLEVTHAHGAKVPPEYTRRQTLKNAERYITPELKEYEERVLTAEERSIALEAELFGQVRDAVAKETNRLLAAADVLASLDLLSSLAELASSHRYVRPTLVDAPVLELREARHPVLDQTLPPGTFVPNDILLSPDTGRFWLITGPNMAGKSVLIKQAALIVLMAQAGSFVPAASAKIGVADRVFTRVGASDELNRGLSTFMVEMTEAANILNNATDRSLVILDEIGRGTSTYDGVSLAWAITEHLHDTVGCRTLFATHYHELAQLAESLSGLRNYNVQVRERDDDVIFLHKIAPGSAERSYGIHVARLAGVPGTVLERASSVLAELEARHQLPDTPGRFVIDPPEKPRKKKPKPATGPMLFGEAE